MTTSQSTPKGASRRTRVLLLNPPLPHNRRLKRIFPMGLLYLASYLRKHSPHAAVEIFNPQVMNTGFKDTLSETLAREWDVLGMGYWTNQFQFVHRLSKAIRASGHKGLIVHGGVHPTVRPADALQSADAVVLHEGEKTFAEIVASVSAGAGDMDLHIPGVVFKRDGEFATAPFAGFNNDLDDLPFPAWELLDLKRYQTPMHVVGGARFPVIGSRGCPYNCSFCLSPALWRRRVRWRSPENIVDELQYESQRFGVNQFHFWDDNLLLNRKHITGVAEEILKRNLKVRWVGLSRASHVVRAETIMPLLARAGLIGMEIGIESANPAAYDLTGKNQTLDDLRKACEIQKRHKMFPMYTYMSYLPGDTIRGAYEQAEFMDDLLHGLPRYKYFHHLPVDIYIGQCCTPHVGTRMIDDAASLGRPMWENEEDFHHSATCFLPHSLLEDRPVRRSERLSADHRVFCVFTASVAIADYLSYDGPIRNAFNIAALNRLLDRFWASCDGGRTLLEVGKELHDETSSGLSLDETLRFLAAFSITLAQVGVLDSADSDPSRPMTEKTLNYRAKHAYRGLVHAARILGRLLGQTGFKMERHRSYDT